jgi:hypothetical protein
MRLNKKFLAGITSAALLAGAPSAYAVSSAQQAYSKPGGIVETQLDNGGGGNHPGAATQNTVVSTPETAPQAKSSSLPFTGLDLVLVVGAGGILIGLGFAMRRMARRSGLA